MRRRLKTATLIAGFFIFSGCAELVTKNYSPPGGVVRYSTGWFLAGKNREKAIEQMRAYCSPKRAVLLGEDSKTEFTGQSYSTSQSQGNYTNTDTTQAKEGYVYLRFACKK